MTMTNPRHYLRPATLEEALESLKKNGSVALAGGGLLLAGVTLAYETVIDVQAIPTLSQITEDGSGLRMGGAASLQAVIESDSLSADVKASITRTVPVNRRNGLSIHESLTAARPPVEWLAMLAALGAAVDHTGFEKDSLNLDGESLPLTDFITGVIEHGFPYNGLVLALTLPDLAGVYTGQAQVARTPADPPVVNAAAAVSLTDENRVGAASLALGGVDARPVVGFDLANLVGRPLTESAITAAANAIESQVNPVSDYRGSADYRREMAVVMARRALQNCLLHMNQV